MYDIFRHFGIPKPCKLLCGRHKKFLTLSAHQVKARARGMTISLSRVTEHCMKPAHSSSPQPILPPLGPAKGEEENWHRKSYIAPKGPMNAKAERGLSLSLLLAAASALIEGRDWDLAVQAERPETELSGGNRERGHCLVDGGPLSKRGWQGGMRLVVAEEALQFENGDLQGDSGRLKVGLG